MLEFLTAIAFAVPSVAAEQFAVEALRAWNVPGAAVVVVRGDQTLVLKGFGVRQLGKPEPITADTLFPLASCSKAFTTTLLAMLADDDVIRWDDPLRKHLPDFKLSDPNADALLTIRDLLCHRTGLAPHDLLWFHAPWSIDETLKRAQLLPLDYPFRSGFRYSSIPPMVAGRAIEKRSGEKWEKLVRTRICEPLGMKGVALSTSEIPPTADRATGHRASKDGKIAVTPVYEITEPNASLSVFATPRDVGAWLKFHLADGVGPEGNRLVSIKNLNETKTPHNVIRLEESARVNNPDTVQLSYALGWLVYDHRGKKVISHGGLIDGFRCQLTILPEQNVAFAVLTNLHDTRMNPALTNSLIDLFCGLPPRDWNAYFKKVGDDEAANRKATLDARNAARNPDKKLTLPLKSYAGEFTHAAYGTATVRARGEKLVLVWSSFEFPLEHFEGDVFRIADGLLEERLVTFTVKGQTATGMSFLEQEFKRK